MGRKGVKPASGAYTSLAALVRATVGDASIRQIINRTGGELSSGPVMRLLNGDRVEPETLAIFARAYGVDEGRLRVAMGLLPVSPERAQVGMEEIDPAPYLAALRAVQPVSAGVMRRTPLDAAIETHGGNIRAYLVRGDCMAPVLRDGDEVLVLPPATVRDGDYVIATVDYTEATCKRVRIEADAAWLEPINGEGRVSEDRFVVTGVVLRVMRSPEKMLG